VYVYNSNDDVQALIDSIEPTAYIQPSEEDADELSLSDIYSFLPSGLISTTTSTTRMTGTQSRLFDYANSTGSYIETYFETWGTRQASILRRYIEDPTDEYKKAEAHDLADALIQLSKDLSEI